MPTPAAEPSRVGAITVVGNAATDSARIVRSFEVAPGSRFSDEELRRGIRKLFALGLFDDVWLEKQQRGEVVDVVIHVRERPRIAKIEFSGNRKRETSELERKLFLHPGSVYSPTAVATQVDSLTRFYRDEGFARASIDAVADTLSDGRVGLRLVVREGEKVKITLIRFEGATAFSSKKLRKQMKTKAKGFFGGGDVKEENFVEDRHRLEDFFHNHGYRDMRVVSEDLAPGPTPRKLALVVKVEQGPRYRIGQAAWSGNQVVDLAALQKTWELRPGQDYDASAIDKTISAAYGLYQEKGYLYLNIDPQETVHDSTVDIRFAITEGRPSEVRLVNISGNKSTREKVIRREMSIHEGDRFRRSSLMRTQGDIFRLGIFEDVQIDFTPADSTNVDINLKVKEKQVGTASAGAGYTSQYGLTGFIDLGHNNVLGNAQSLQLHLERGDKTSNYSLSFTEPWFHDTPTLLGFSVFSIDRDLDLYQEKRAGGSARIGRPLPWPDYSRGTISYSLENVTINRLGSGLTAEDSVALVGIPVGQAVLTSSVETVFSRNDTDNPFYPTKGSRLTIDDEFAGGPFGGSINFHKHRIDGRLYLPSLLKGVTTMLRARIGLLGEYGDQNLEVPRYERFRLGGGTTSDPLRGYDDYQVVPSKFIQDIVVSRDTVFYSSGPDSGQIQQIIPLTQRVRYPGGRFAATYTLEQQFPIVHPVHGVIFFDAGNTWDLWREIRPLDLKLGAGIGFRLEIPLLGNIGFDYGYGFNRDDGARWKGHFLIGNFN